LYRSKSGGETVTATALPIFVGGHPIRLMEDMKYLTVFSDNGQGIVILDYRPDARRAVDVYLTSICRLCIPLSAEIYSSCWKANSYKSGSEHDCKYSLAYVVAGECVIRYDNEAGKGDHRHLGEDDPDTPSPARLIC
jgi:hypothetical protein